MSNKKPARVAHCAQCDQDVKPVEQGGLALLFTLPALLAFAAFMASLIAAAHTFAPSTVHGGAIVVLWPVAAVANGWVHPKLLAVILAFVAFLAVGSLSQKGNEYLERHARCPECQHLVGSAPQPQT